MTYSNHNANKSWTQKEVSQLKQMINQNTPTSVIGFKIGRTENAIRAEASKLGLSLKPTNQSPYNRKKR